MHASLLAREGRLAGAIWSCLLLNVKQPTRRSLHLVACTHHGRLRQLSVCHSQKCLYNPSTTSLKANIISTRQSHRYFSIYHRLCQSPTCLVLIHALVDVISHVLDLAAALQVLQQPKWNTTCSALAALRQPAPCIQTLVAQALALTQPRPASLIRSFWLVLLAYMLTETD